MAMFPIFGKGFVPEKKKRKTEAEINIKRQEYEITERKREFQIKWLKEFTWLGYENNKMTCTVCINFGSETVGPFVQGCSTFRKNSLQAHERSDGHIMNVKRESASKNPDQTIAVKTLQTLNSKTINQLKLKFRNVHFLCTSGKPFTDYIQFCQLDEAKLLDVGSQYRTEKSAIEFAKYIAEAERERMRRYLETCKFISVISDGTTDCSHQEAEIVFIRTCLKGEIKVYFSLVKNVPRGDSETICNVLVSGLELLCPDFRQKLVGTGTDGASSMLGAKSGCVQRLRDLTQRPFIVGVHCSGHKLELAFRDALKSKITLFNKVDLLLLNIYYFYRNSNVTRSGLKDSYRVLGRKILLPVRVGGTRWLSHLKAAIKVFLDGYDAFVLHLGQLQNRDEKTSRTEKGNKALHYYRAVKSKDVFLMLHFLLDVLTVLSEVSKKFQEKTCLITDVFTEIDMAKKALEKFKTRDGLRLREAYANPKLNDMTGNDSSFVSARKKLLSALIDSLNKRFTDNPGIIGSCGIFSLKLFPSLETEAKDYGDEDVDILVDHFKSALETAEVDVENISSEWTKLKCHIYKRFSKPNEATWKEVNSKLGQMCPNILQLVDLVLAIPASSADAERGFSRLKNTKTDKRARLLDINLSDQITIMMESADVSTYDPIPAINMWNVGCVRRVKQSNVVVSSERVNLEHESVDIVDLDKNSNFIDNTDSEPALDIPVHRQDDAANTDSEPALDVTVNRQEDAANEHLDDDTDIQITEHKSDQEDNMNNNKADFVNRNMNDSINNKEPEFLDNYTQCDIKTSDVGIQVYIDSTFFEDQVDEDREEYESDCSDYDDENDSDLFEPKMNFTSRLSCAKDAFNEFCDVWGRGGE